MRNMSAYLVEHFGYKREDMVLLTDDQQNPMSQPTKQNILRAMHWLVKDARPNDSLFFHYSGALAISNPPLGKFADSCAGHGGQTKDLDGDEEDGYDEVIYPVDFRQVGHITDDEMHRILVKPLQPGTRLTAIFDSCHSGTALDLPYIYSTQGILKEPNLAKEAGQGLLGVIASYSQGDIGGMIKKGMGFFTKATGGEEARNRALATKTSPADVIMLSGSKDDQTSYVSFCCLFRYFLSYIGSVCCVFGCAGIMDILTSVRKSNIEVHEQEVKALYHVLNLLSFFLLFLIIFFLILHFLLDISKSCWPSKHSAKQIVIPETILLERSSSTRESSSP